MRSIRVDNIEIVCPDDLVVLSVTITTEYRQIVVVFDDQTKPTESE